MCLPKTCNYYNYDYLNPKYPIIGYIDPLEKVGLACRAWFLHNLFTLFMQGLLRSNLPKHSGLGFRVTPHLRLTFVFQTYEKVASCEGEAHELLVLPG